MRSIASWFTPLREKVRLSVGDARPQVVKPSREKRGVLGAMKPKAPAVGGSRVVKGEDGVAVGYNPRGKRRLYPLAGKILHFEVYWILSKDAAVNPFERLIEGFDGRECAEHANRPSPGSRIGSAIGQKKACRYRARPVLESPIRDPSVPVRWVCSRERLREESAE